MGLNVTSLEGDMMGLNVTSLEGDMMGLTSLPPLSRISVAKLPEANFKIFFRVPHH
jgi:hypothetical protein